MPDEKVSLADKIRNKLDAGLLPRVVANMMWSGYGHDNPCGCCDEPIGPAQIEYEFEMIPQDSDGGFRFHIGCLGMWLAELRRRGLVVQNGELSLSLMDRPSLRDVIRRKLDDFTLPTNAPNKMYTGYGSGAPCDACGDPVLPAQTEYKWGYPEDDQPRAFRMHLGCVGIWEALRRKRGLDPAL